MRRRLRNFEDKFGAGYTEVNALKEQELAQILGEAVERYRDRRLFVKVFSADVQAQGMLEEETEELIGRHRENLARIIHEAEFC